MLASPASHDRCGREAPRVAVAAELASPSHPRSRWTRSAARCRGCGARLPLPSSIAVDAERRALPWLRSSPPLPFTMSPPVSEGTETTGATGPGPRSPPATRDPPATIEVARSSAPSRASSLRSSPAATLDLACGPWKEPVRGGSQGTGGPVKLVPKEAGGDTRSPWTRSAASCCGCGARLLLPTTIAVAAERRELPGLRSTASWSWRFRIRSGHPSEVSLEMADIVIDAMNQARRCAVPAFHTRFRRARLPLSSTIAVAAERRALPWLQSTASWSWRLRMPSGFVCEVAFQRQRHLKSRISRLTR